MRPRSRYCTMRVRSSRWTCSSRSGKRPRSCGWWTEYPARTTRVGPPAPAPARSRWWTSRDSTLDQAAALWPPTARRASSPSSTISVEAAAALAERLGLIYHSPAGGPRRGGQAAPAGRPRTRRVSPARFWPDPGRAVRGRCARLAAPSVSGGAQAGRGEREPGHPPGRLSPRSCSACWGGSPGESAAWSRSTSRTAPCRATGWRATCPSRAWSAAGGPSHVAITGGSPWPSRSARPATSSPAPRPRLERAGAGHGRLRRSRRWASPTRSSTPRSS